MTFVKGGNNPKGKRFSKEHQPPKGKVGRPPKLPRLDELMAKILGEEKDGISAGEAILAALRSRASKGDVKAAALLLDRGYGKVKTEIDITSNGETLGALIDWSNDTKEKE